MDFDVQNYWDNHFERYREKRLWVVPGIVVVYACSSSPGG